jgi:hypothetical protein
VCGWLLLCKLKFSDRGCGQYSRVSGLWTRRFLMPLALMGSANQVPIGLSNPEVPDAHRGFLALG